MTQKIEWLYPSNGNPPDIPKKYKEKDKISTIGVVLFQSKTPLFNDILDNIELFYKDFYVISDSETALNVIKNNLLFDINHFEEIRQSLSDYYLKTYNIKLNGVPQWDDKLENWIRDVYVGDVKITITNCENPNIYLYTDIEVKKYFNDFLEYFGISIYFTHTRLKNQQHSHQLILILLAEMPLIYFAPFSSIIIYTTICSLLFPNTTVTRLRCAIFQNCT